MKYDDGCGRYSLNTTAGALQKRYNLAKEHPQFSSSFDVKPGQTLPVIIGSEDGKLQPEMMKWGLIPSWSKDPKMAYKLFNARDDNLFKSPIWRSVILHKRVIIPATGFFEWVAPEKGSKQPKQKYYFHPRQLSIYSFAGVWDSWRDVENKEWGTYSIITTEPNKELRPFHDRMPVILHQEDEAAWLEPSRIKREDIEPFLRPLEDNALEVVEVSSDVSAIEYNDERRIAPVNSQ